MCLGDLLLVSNSESREFFCSDEWRIDGYSVWINSVSVRIAVWSNSEFCRIFCSDEWKIEGYSVLMNSVSGRLAV